METRKSIVVGLDFDGTELDNALQKLEEARDKLWECKESLDRLGVLRIKEADHKNLPQNES